jgi:hypothetical protein|tara:strand:+ start:9704 stop:10078 length:375 start_codon:yes stop_codon:yes gene_type:complete
MALNKTQKIILAVGGVGLLYFFTQKKEKCDRNKGIFILDEKEVCEKDLKEKGYYLWIPTTPGRSPGYYHISSWDGGFGEALNLAWVPKAIENVLTRQQSDPMFQQGQNLLETYYVGGEKLLQIK